MVWRRGDLSCRGWWGAYIGQRAFGGSRNRRVLELMEAANAPFVGPMEPRLGGLGAEAGGLPVGRPVTDHGPRMGIIDISTSKIV
jgi:hypothetical protein